MLQQRQSLLIYGDNLIKVDAASFDGTNDYMTRGANLTGAVDGKTGILSFWFKIDGGDGTDMTIFHGATTLAGNAAHIRARRTSANKMEIVGLNAAGTTLFTLTSTSTMVTGSAWRNILSSWNCGTGVAVMYTNDSLDATTAPTNDNVNYALADYAVGAQASGLTKFNGGLAEMYFQPNAFLDFSVVANRRKFISFSLKPVSLGSTGAAPTGTAAILYNHLDHGETANDFATNRGTGGNMTVTGALTTEGTSPSD